MESVKWKMESYDYQHLMRSWILKVTMHLLVRHGNHNFPFSILHFPLSTLPMIRRNFNRTGGMETLLLFMAIAVGIQAQNILNVIQKDGTLARINIAYKNDATS